MKRVLSIALIVCAAAGCRSERPPAALAPPPPAVEAGDEITEAQPKLPTVNLRIGSKILAAEIARTPREHQVGMMFRTAMGENEAMLFVFPAPHRTSFWMKNTTVPLSCAYLDASGMIVEIHEFKPLNEEPVPSGSDRIQYALEVPRGWFERNRIFAGDIVRTETGTLRETFFGSSR